MQRDFCLELGMMEGFSSSRVTLLCLNCDLLVDASGGDLMTKHLSDRPNHVCKVIQEKGMSSSASATKDEVCMLCYLALENVSCF